MACVECDGRSDRAALSVLDSAQQVRASTAAMTAAVAEIGRLRTGITDYFLNGYPSQEARELALWRVLHPDGTSP